MSERLLAVPLHTDRVIVRDMARAGVEARGFGGKADFHSLRKSYATFTDQAWATEREAMAAMRHRPVGITYSTYVQFDEGRLKALAEKVGNMVFAAQEQAESMQYSMQRKAAGAEGLVITPLPDSGIGQVQGGRVAGSNPVAPTIFLPPVTH